MFTDQFYLKLLFPLRISLSENLYLPSLSHPQYVGIILDMQLNLLRHYQIYLLHSHI